MVRHTPLLPPEGVVKKRVEQQRRYKGHHHVPKGSRQAQSAEDAPHKRRHARVRQRQKRGDDCRQRQPHQQADEHGRQLLSPPAQRGHRGKRPADCGEGLDPKACKERRQQYALPLPRRILLHEHEKQQEQAGHKEVIDKPELPAAVEKVPAVQNQRAQEQQHCIAVFPHPPPLIRKIDQKGDAPEQREAPAAAGIGKEQRGAGDTDEQRAEQQPARLSCHGRRR